MKVFLSSTFIDLKEEREAVLRELQKRKLATRAMEYFVASPSTPQDTALTNLRDSDLMLLVIGFKAGSLLPDGSGGTYTSAEYDELLKIGKEPLVFLREEKRWPWSRRKTWRNAEKDNKKKRALEEFKNQVGAKWTWDRFSSPDQLALDVIQAIDRWEANGRPGARTTFASLPEYFRSKSPSGHFQILDFDTTLLGRDNEIQSLQDFMSDPSQRVCILSGRGGIGKSKLLHDWAKLNANVVLFLKDAPLWHPDSDKEVPIDTNVLVVDDAHRQESLPRLLQLFNEIPRHRGMKLIVSTRPGGSARIAQDVFRMKIDPAQVTQLPELQELSREQSRALAEQVLGNEFKRYADHLAEVAGNSPLVIVAGGHLIASQKVDPSSLTTLDEFRSTIFNRFLDEMNLAGPMFPIDPPRPLLELIAALGPVEVTKYPFEKLAESFLNRPVDEILRTFDALAENGIITSRDKPVRILPDVLSDFILEDCCIGSGGRSTYYADRVYHHFGAHSLKELMRNLAELDWRRGRSGESGLNFLDGIWTDIQQRFRAGDEYARHSILSDLASAAIYQPERVLSLINTAINDPVEVDSSGEGSRYRVGQEYVSSALPNLLEAVAHHADRLPEAVSILWELSKASAAKRGSAEGAQSVIKRLSSWRRYGHPALNFAMLLQAIRLAKRPDAFTGDFTPFEIIEEILEREGEFTEWQDENAMSFGSFGLNYAAVGPVRESTLDYLEFILGGDGRPAYIAIGLLERLLHNFLNRMGRGSSEEEERWQNRERERCLETLVNRYHLPSSPLLASRLYDAVRSATAINCPPSIRERARAALDHLTLDDAGKVVDAICTAGHNLPILSPNLDLEQREQRFADLMLEAKAALGRIGATPALRASFLIDQVTICETERVTTEGFRHFMAVFVDDREFLLEMADQLEANHRRDRLIGCLSAVFHALRSADAEEFRRRARIAIENEIRSTMYAIASNLRVWEGAIPQDVAVIRAFGEYPDPATKRDALFAIAYMGKFVALHRELKDVALSIDPQGDATVAEKLADAFYTYGLPLTMLSREEARVLASRFLSVEDWDSRQSVIPRFLNRFTPIFPDESLGLLIERIIRDIANSKVRLPRLRSFGLLEENVSFDAVPAEKRHELGRQCIDLLMDANEGTDEYTSLFWLVAGSGEVALKLILDVVVAGQKEIGKIVRLIESAKTRLAFSNPAFAKELIRQFHGEQRKEIIDAFAHQAGRHGGAGGFAGSYEKFVTEQERLYQSELATLPDDPDLRDLIEALHRRS
jgi:hypothetical protein